MLSIGPSTGNSEDYNMKILKNIFDFVSAIRCATYAGHLARNGKIKEAQSYYR